MNKNLKYFCKILLVMLFFISSSYSYAVNNPPNSTTASNTIENVKEVYNERNQEENYQNVDGVFEDFANRMVLGVFGKTALTYFIENKIDDNLRSDIVSLTENEVKQYSKPFNYVISSMVFVVLKSSLFIVFVLLALYFSWLVLETLLRTQDTGEFLGSSWSKLFSPIKVSFAVLMITPMFGEEFSNDINSQLGSSLGSESEIDLLQENDFSLSQVIMLKVLGESNIYANKIWHGFVDAQEQYYPAIKMPNVTSKRADFLNFIDHVVCLSTTSSDVAQTELNFSKGYEDFSSFGPYFISKSRNHRCSLEFKMPFDLRTYDDIKKDNFLENLGINIDYEKVQTDMNQELLSDVTPKVKIVSDAIISMIASKNNNMANVTAFSEEKIYKVNEKNWRLYCDDILSGGALPEFVNEENIAKYKFYSANCLSKDFVLRSSSVSNAPDLEYPYSDVNYLKKKEIELCVDQSLDTNKLTKVSLEEGAPNSIKSCIETACFNGSPYECSTAINFGKSLVERNKIAEKGWILSGAYSYKFFSSFKNDASKSLINDISINFEQVEVPKSRLPPGRFPSSASVQTQAVDPSVINADYIEDEASTPAFSVNLALTTGVISFEEYQDYYQETKNSERELKSTGSIENIITGDDGFLGVKEFTTCVKNPISITNGYQCGSVTEETQDFGIKMLSTSVQMMIIKSVLNSIKRVGKELDKKDNYDKNYPKTEVGKMSNGAHDKVGQAAGLILGIIGISAGIEIGDVINTYLSDIVASGSFSQVEYDLLFNRDIVAIGAVLGLEAFLSSDSGIANVLISVFIILGVLFGLILPLMPFLIFLIAFAGFMLLFFESLITVMIWSVLIISPSRDHSSDYAKKGIVMILTVFLRAPLIVFGLIVAWLLNNILIGEILSAISIDSAIMQEGSWSIKSIIDVVVIMGVQIFLLYLLYNLIFSIIEGLYDIAQKWLFGSTSASPFGSKNRGQEFAGIKNNLQQFKPQRFKGLK